MSSLKISTVPFAWIHFLPWSSSIPHCHYINECRKENVLGFPVWIKPARVLSTLPNTGGPSCSSVQMLCKLQGCFAFWELGRFLLTHCEPNSRTQPIGQEEGQGACVGRDGCKIPLL
jgi:hypothetical protein